MVSKQIEFIRLQPWIIKEAERTPMTRMVNGFQWMERLIEGLKKNLRNLQRQTCHVDTYLRAEDKQN